METRRTRSGGSRNGAIGAAAVEGREPVQVQPALLGAARVPLHAAPSLVRGLPPRFFLTLTRRESTFRPHDPRARERADRRLRWWSKRLLDMAEVHTEVRNPHGVDLPAGRPVIIMSNHASLYDIPIIFVSLPGSIRMLTKKELFRVPIWGRGMRAGEFISIDRHDRVQAMRDLDRLYPGYGFAGHKGYGTAAHREAIYRHGPCPCHRRSFAPVRDWLEVAP